MAKVLFINKGQLGGPTQSLLKLLAYINHLHDIQVLIYPQGELKDILDRQAVFNYSFPVRYRSIPTVYRILKQQKIDLVYANSFNASSWRVLLATKLAKCRFIWHIREIMNVDEQNPYRVRKRVGWADQVIAVSEACGQSVRKVAPRVPVTVVYNGVDLIDFQFEPEFARQFVLKTFGLSENTNVLVSVGTFTQRKNQREAILAVSRIIRQTPNVHYFLFGESHPTYLQDLKTLIQELGLENNIHLMSFRKDVPVILAGADVFIHTAVVDPHPRAVLEALAAGLAVVAYNVDGVGETVVDGKNGFLVPVNAVDQLEQRIRSLLEDPGTRYHFGKNGRQMIKNYFSTEQTAQKVHAVINQVLQGRAVN